MPVQGRKKTGCQLLSVVLNYLKALDNTLFFCIIVYVNSKNNH